MKELEAQVCEKKMIQLIPLRISISIYTFIFVIVYIEDDNYQDINYDGYMQILCCPTCNLVASLIPEYLARKQTKSL